MYRRWGDNCFNDIRSTVVVEDAKTYIHNCPLVFDHIVFDLTLRTKESKECWSTSFFTDVLKRLKEGGTLSLHLGFVRDVETHSEIMALVPDVFLIRDYFIVPECNWSFLICDNYMGSV